jgi:hypothetical protein
MPSWVSKPPKRAQWGRRQAAMPFASSFVLLENEEQFIRPRVADDISLFNPQSNFVTCISLS